MRFRLALAVLLWAPRAFGQQATGIQVQVPLAPGAVGAAGAAANVAGPGINASIGPALSLPSPIIAPIVPVSPVSVVPTANGATANGTVKGTARVAATRTAELPSGASREREESTSGGRLELSAQKVQSGAPGVGRYFRSSGRRDAASEARQAKFKEPAGIGASDPTEDLLRQNQRFDGQGARAASMPAILAPADGETGARNRNTAAALTPALSRFAGEGERRFAGEGERRFAGRLAAADPEPVPAPTPAEPEVTPQAKRTIRGFALARTFSIAAYTLYNIAFAGMAIDAVGRGSFATLGVVGGFLSIPLAFLNGVLVDKLTPRQILIGGSGLLATVALITAGLKAAGMITLPVLVPLFVVTQFMLVAILVGEGSLVPKILGGNKGAIQKTNAIFDLIFAGVGAVGSLAGSFLVGHLLGHVGTFLVYAAVQALVVIPIYMIFMPKGVAPGKPAGKGFGEAFQILRKNPYLLGLLGLTLAGIFLVYPLRLTLLPVIVKTFLHGGDAMIGYVNTAVFTGMLGASLFNTFWSSKFKNARLLQVGALAFLSFGIILAVPGSLAAMFAGVAAVFLLHTVALNVLRSLYMTEAQQQHPEFIGRLMGINSAMYGLAIAGGTWLVKAALAGAAYPALLWWLALPYAGAAVAMFVAPMLLNLWYKKTHPEGPKPL